MFAEEKGKKSNGVMEEQMIMSGAAAEGGLWWEALDRRCRFCESIKVKGPGWLREFTRGKG